MSRARAVSAEAVAMRTRLVLLTALAAAASAVAGPTAAEAARSCTAGAVTQAGPYRVALVIGPRSEMYTAEEVRTRRLKTGQVMLGGAMAMIEKVPAGMRIYDLQVYVCTKSGAVVTNLKPTITVAVPGRKPANVPVAMMAAVAKGFGDYHYGNDVALKPGATATVTVAIKDARAVLRATAPKSGSSADPHAGMDMG
jgi:hypothetical protein